MYPPTPSIVYVSSQRGVVRNEIFRHSSGTRRARNHSGCIAIQCVSLSTSGGQTLTVLSCQPCLWNRNWWLECSEYFYMNQKYETLLSLLVLSVWTFRNRGRNQIYSNHILDSLVKCNLQLAHLLRNIYLPMARAPSWGWLGHDMVTHMVTSSCSRTPTKVNVWHRAPRWRMICHLTRGVWANVIFDVGCKKSDRKYRD